jgi:hypothetical protein
MIKSESGTGCRARSKYPPDHALEAALHEYRNDAGDPYRRENRLKGPYRRVVLCKDLEELLVREWEGHDRAP